MQSTTARLGYIVPLAMTIALGFVMLGYCNSYFNSMTNILHAQYVYRGKALISNKVLFNSLVSGLIPFGAMFGCLLIGPIAARGRRRALMINASVFIIGVSLTMIFDMWALIFGRLIMGACVGAYVAVCPLFISETAPPSLSGTLGSFSQVGVVFGVIGGFSMAFVMPLPNSPEALTTGMWRLVFGFPALLAFTQLTLLTFVFKYDTPRFYQTHGDTVKLKEINDRIFSVLAIVSAAKPTAQENIAEAPEIPAENPEPVQVEDVDLEAHSNQENANEQVQNDAQTAEQENPDIAKKTAHPSYKKALAVC